MLSIRRLFLAASMLGLAASAGAKPSLAQSSLPVCPPPASNEFLLLVRGDTEAERAEISTILPVESTVLVCQYVDEVVVRAGGFDSLETANAWASYMTTEQGFESFVAQPSSQPVATGSEVAVSGDAQVYQPTRLAAGYAVLVDYGSQPEVATTVGQLVQPVGLAVYQQRAYLLADYTTDVAVASATLQRLSDAQLAVVIVNADQVVRLSDSVSR